MAFVHAKIGQERPRKKKKKVVVQINSYPTRNRKFPKNSKKILKFKKHYKGASLQAKTGWEWQRKRVNKNYRSNQFLPNP